MNYIYYAAAFAGTAWTFYLIGQYTGLKEMNRRLNALVVKNGRLDCLLDVTQNFNTDLQLKAHEATQEASRLSGHVEILQDHLAAIHTYTAGQKSGTAVKVARMAAAGMRK